jgi:hypothetical protein
MDLQGPIRNFNKKSGAGKRLPAPDFFSYAAGFDFAIRSAMALKALVTAESG